MSHSDKTLRLYIGTNPMLYRKFSRYLKSVVLASKISLTYLATEPPLQPKNPNSPLPLVSKLPLDMFSTVEVILSTSIRS